MGGSAHPRSRDEVAHAPPWFAGTRDPGAKTRVYRSLVNPRRILYSHETFGYSHETFGAAGERILRGACEIVVEQDILQKVVQSYAPNVMVANLLKINLVALPEAIGKVNDIFDRCCRFIGSHKQPLETLSIRPTLEQLEADWAELQAIRKSVQG